MNESQVFTNALKLASAAERAAYLDAACAGDSRFRANVESLLEAHAADPRFLEQPAASLGPTEQHDADVNASRESAASPPGGERAGTVLAGRFKLLERIGEGGMGDVWMAQQFEPVKRLVAVKLIKPGMDSKQVLARFEAERHALALMDHPNIAKVLDAGTTEEPSRVSDRVASEDTTRRLTPLGSAGRPFFVMELVKGLPITKYCDLHRLTPRQRLELFVPVCQAIQHAHQKGVIHRDIKPSNVLVAQYDDRPVPKVIDFGVVKAIGQPLTEETLHTGFGAIVGTVEYMSPEQASFNQLDIDTRSDIYSLGVLLYELLAGTPPFSRRELEKAGVLEMLRVIREQEPSKPSTKLSTADGLPTLAANRGTEPKRLTALVRGELDWIVMKALEKDRSQRYATANGLAADVQRYLADEPVLAGPPSAWYRFRKLARRNQRALAAALAFAILLVVGTAVSTWQAVLATRAAQAERKAKTSAENRLTQIEKGIALLGSIFKDLDPQEEEEGGKPLRVLLGERLDQATRELDGEAIGDPLAVAKLQLTLGESQLELGYSDKAIALFTKAQATFTAMLGADHPDTLESMGNLASGYGRDGKLDLARPLFEETFRRTTAKLGPDHPFTLSSMANLAVHYDGAGKFDLALPLYEESLKLRKVKLGPDHKHTLNSMDNLAMGYHNAGKLDLALPLMEETLKLKKAKFGPDHVQTIRSIESLAIGYRAVGKLDLALQLWEELRNFRKAKLGHDHPLTLTIGNNLAIGYHDAGKLDLALPLYEETLKLTKAKSGPDHPHTLSCMNNLALAYKDAGKLDLALPLYEETLKLRKTNLGPDHPATLTTMSNLAQGYRAAGKSALALPLIDESFKLMKAKLGPDHPNTLIAMNNLGAYYGETKRLDLSIPILEELLLLRKRKLGEDHPDTVVTQFGLAVNYSEAGRLAEAIPLLEKAYHSGPKTLTLRYGRELAKAYARVGKTTQSIALCKDIVVSERQRLKDDKLKLASALFDLGEQFLKLNAFADAESVLNESLAIGEELKRDAWLTFSTKALLGGALFGQKQFAKAQPLLAQGYEGMKQREAKMPRNARHLLTEALQRLVQLYEVLRKPAEAAKWQHELETRIKLQSKSKQNESVTK